MYLINYAKQVPNRKKNYVKYIFCYETDLFPLNKCVEPSSYKMYPSAYCDVVCKSEKFILSSLKLKIHWLCFSRLICISTKYEHAIGLQICYNLQCSSIGDQSVIISLFYIVYNLFLLQTHKSKTGGFTQSQKAKNMFCTSHFAYIKSVAQKARFNIILVIVFKIQGLAFKCLCRLFICNDCICVNLCPSF